MTQEITSDEIIKKIQSKGYWSVIIRPLTYKAERFSLSQCEKKVIDAKVRKRGWSYPYITRHREIINYIKFVQTYVDWNNHTELWRMYKDGQFIHLFSCWEDGDEGIRIFSPERKIVNPGYGLSLLMTIYTIYEIYEFTSRLCKEDYEDGIQVKIKLTGIKDRKLVTVDFGRTIYEYICRVNEIPLERRFDYSDLVANKKEYVTEDVMHIFQIFNWKNPNKKMIGEEFDKIEKGLI